MKTKFKLALMRCPNHGYQAISLDDDGGGVRLTEGKCCGRWTTIKEWPMTIRQLREAAEEFMAAANEAAEENDHD